MIEKIKLNQSGEAIFPWYEIAYDEDGYYAAQYADEPAWDGERVWGGWRSAEEIPAEPLSVTRLDDCIVSRLEVALSDADFAGTDGICACEDLPEDMLDGDYGICWMAKLEDGGVIIAQASNCRPEEMKASEEILLLFFQSLQWEDGHLEGAGS